MNILSTHRLASSLLALFPSVSAPTSPEPFQSSVQAGQLCATYVRDAAAPGNCLPASSVPTLGALYPLSQDLYVSPQGFVGIGTSDPGAKLDVAGSVHALGGLLSVGAYPTLKLKCNTPQQYAEFFWQAAPEGSCYLYDVSRAAYRIHVDSAGNVTLGSSAANAALNVWGNLFVNGAGDIGAATGDRGVDDMFFDGGADSISGIYLPSKGGNNDALFIVDPINGLVASFHDSGSVGIGTAVPSSRLDVNGQTTTESLRIRGGSDVVEAFDSADETLEPGTVVALDAEHHGSVVASSTAYDKRVVGVVSGAGGVNPGLVLSQEGVLDGNVQVAMVGRVYVKCSAENGAIEVGDLLTSGSLAGHAMKATDSGRAFGTVIGKAASSLAEGTGLVLVVVNLQ